MFRTRWSASRPSWHAKKSQEEGLDCFSPPLVATSAGNLHLSLGLGRRWRNEHHDAEALSCMGPSGDGALGRGRTRPELRLGLSAGISQRGLGGAPWKCYQQCRLPCRAQTIANGYRRINLRRRTLSSVPTWRQGVKSRATSLSCSPRVPRPSSTAVPHLVNCCPPKSPNPLLCADCQ